MAVEELLHRLVLLFHLFFLGTFQEFRWTTFVIVWIARLLSFSVVFRIYIGPWALTHIAGHVKVRSVSLRSIRGIYFRAGYQTWNVDRIGISYRGAGTMGSSRLSLKIEGLKLEIATVDIPQPNPQSRPRGGTITLADLSPSPIARWIWGAIADIYYAVDPYVRPLVRTSFVAGLRLIIRCLPALTQHLDFQLDSATITFASLPGTKIHVKEAYLHLELAFTQLESVILRSEETQPGHKSRMRSFSIAWKSRLSKSFSRTWYRAWGKTQGCASLSFKVQNIEGSTNGKSGNGFPSDTLFNLPGAVELNTSVSFIPKRGIVEPHSLKTRLTVGAVFISANAALSILETLKKANVGFDSSLDSNSPSDTETAESPLTPISPIFEALSSMRVQRFHKRHQAGLRGFRASSWLSSLQEIDIQFASFKISYSQLGLGDMDYIYEANVQDISLRASLSNATRNPLHHEWLGSVDKPEIFEADAYSLTCSIRGATLDRFGVKAQTSHLCLLSLGSVELQTLVSQWPSPWQGIASFMSGDPNAPLLVIFLKLENLEMTERLDYLKHLLTRIAPVADSNKSSPLLPAVLPNVPRFALNVVCGEIRGRLICMDVQEEPLLVEGHTDGFMFSAHSCFHSNSLSSPSAIATYADKLPVQMRFKIAFVLSPTFVRVLSDRSGCFTPQQSFPQETEDLDTLCETAISLESVEIAGDGETSGKFDDDGDEGVSLDVSSTFLDVHSTSEALAIELWHPNVVSAVSRILSVLYSQSPPTHPVRRSRVLDGLPSGLSASISIARVVVFVVGPDLNPNDDQELSRGFAFLTGLQVQYCSLQSSQVKRHLGHHQRAQTRQKLYLSEEPVLAAVNASSIAQKINGFFVINLWDLSLRSATATKYVADNPYMAEKDDPALIAQEYIRVQNIRLSMHLCGGLGPSSTIPDTCDFELDIPYLRGNFQLSHLYSFLLALHTLKSILPPSHQVPSPKASSELSCRFKGSIKTVQIFWYLRQQKLVTRIDFLATEYASSKLVETKWQKFFFWVPAPAKVNRWEDTKDNKWEELACLQQWTLSGPLPMQRPLRINIEGESARVRIPFGYILYDLIRDITLTVKCLRHLMCMVAGGRFYDMPAPVPESAKKMPYITLWLRNLFLEAEDDSLESKLSLIWRAGAGAAKSRFEREEAFRAKVAAIRAAVPQSSQPSLRDIDTEYQFSPEHTVSIEEARQRLSQVHVMDWTLRHRLMKEGVLKEEETIVDRIRVTQSRRSIDDVPNMVQVTPIEHNPPLFRAIFSNLLLNATAPSFPLESLPDFLFEHGGGLPRETEFSLLLPMHLNFTLASLRVALRNYPVPLVDIPSNGHHNQPSWEFDSDLVIAEEMGTEKSVDWFEYIIADNHEGIHRNYGMCLHVPKTIMPVKTYANPIVRVTTDGVTTLSWNVSYGPAIQDFLGVVETLTSPPRDLSPIVGFWDKLRLVFHWTARISFKNEVRLHMKGSRDPHKVAGEGAGFALCWHGHSKLLVGIPNDDGELIQVISDTMSIVIPDLQQSKPAKPLAYGVPGQPGIGKVCAKFGSGVRFGVGFVLERSCGLECESCSGPAFYRRCRIFDFRPHYDVKLERKSTPPIINSPEDSYNEFRSNFIHLSISLTSAVRSTIVGASPVNFSSLHLSPKCFSHFWSWWALFDSALSLPVRQGSYHPPKHVSPKFGRHLATIKYRLSVPQLFISHVYVDDSRETWADGITPFVGVKAKIGHFQADLHQRDQETTGPGLMPNTTKVTRHKSFYAVEVVLKELDLRTLLATFPESLKQSVPVDASPERGNYGSQHNLAPTDPPSVWIDLNDYIETDWVPPASPTLHILPVGACPHFTYFKRYSRTSQTSVETSKFGVEGTHTCLLGKEASVPQIQIRLAIMRIAELRKVVADKRARTGKPNDANAGLPQIQSTEKMILLLEEYIGHLQDTDVAIDYTDLNEGRGYHMPSDSVSPDEWADFENVYQVHNPHIFVNNAIRDIMMRYYYCSRARRGLEYHMATRAVKFIRDQAEAALNEADGAEQRRGPASSAQAAAVALRKLLVGAVDSKPSVDVSGNTTPPGVVDPLNGWSEGVSLRKSHFCLLLKPQVVLRSSADSTCVLAAVQAKLQSFAVMDNANLEDPISGKVMNRSYISLGGLQSFAPASLKYAGDGCVPLEVMIDFRCETNNFERLVPQTDATCHYDKFNRLRLRNNVTSVARASTDRSALVNNNHLQDQTDLVRVHVPRFTVSANEQHFQAISSIVTKLLLFSDPIHKTRLDKLETLLFTYDFTDLSSAAHVVADLQGRLRSAIETEQSAELRLRESGIRDNLDLLKLKAHIFLLSEELNYIFDAIKLAQDRADDRTDQKSALLLHASSSEISWRMLDDERDLLAKIDVRNINYSWLSRQDSSTVNNLAVGDLQAFDGSPHAVWAEILSKNYESTNHPLLKRGLFVVADWTVLAPVGGITIYEDFELSLHPMRLQLDARVGVKIMEYVWPARRHRNRNHIHRDIDLSERSVETPPPRPPITQRSSLDSSLVLQLPRKSLDANRLSPTPLRKIGVSRSFTDLRSAASESLQVHDIQRTGAVSETHRSVSASSEPPQNKVARKKREHTFKSSSDKGVGDAAEMKTRSSQKAFVYVKISSLHLLLSIMKDKSFECRDARIRTRDLEYRNQTWSFEELVDQFIPSDMSWRGWVKMALHQPLVPVLPVARELISKTKWSVAKGVSHVEGQVTPPAKLLRAKVLDEEVESEVQPQSTRRKRSRTSSPHRRWLKASHRGTDDAHVTTRPLTTEPEPIGSPDNFKELTRAKNRSRMTSLFSRSSGRTRRGTETSSSTSSIPTLMLPHKESGQSPPAL